MFRFNAATKTSFALVLACTVLANADFFSSAASYHRTPLKDMVSSAGAIAEVRVVSHSYPVGAPDEFLRTSVQVTILKTLKGSLPETLALDLPGGIQGNKVDFIADSAEFVDGERAMVFIKEPTAGHYMVNNLGLGKFNIVEREGQVFVESPLCPKAMESNAGAEADLIVKSIPYLDFCTLVSSYAKNEEPAMSPIKLAMTLRQSGSHICDPEKPCGIPTEVLRLQNTGRKQHEVLSIILAFGFMAMCAGTIVALRRKNALKKVAVPVAKSLALALAVTLLSGVTTGGKTSLAYVASGPIWNLDDTSSPSKVSGGKIVWKQSTQVSKTNANCYTDAATSFAKWGSVSNCRLGFTNAGTVTNTTHSSNDGVNFLVWDPNPSSDFSSATLGITYSSYTIGTPSYFADCDIVFNDRDFNWGTGGNGNVKSVSLHEIGHFVGLAHTTNNTAVMYPYDQGYLALSADELLAAQTFYPFKGSTTPPPAPTTPPSVTLSGSPLSGTVPLTSGFDASGSTATTAGATITSYAWNFGDGATASGKTTGHTYTTPGTYTASVTVTDSKGSSNSTTVTVNVASTGTPIKGSFKLLFVTSGHDTFNAVLSSDQLTGYNPTGTVSGTVTIAGTSYPFSYNPLSKKAIGSSPMKITVSTKSNTVTIALKNANLTSAFAALGAANANSSGTTVNVPVSVQFNDGSALQISASFPFNYAAVASKYGMGAY